jgi:hypothetical protein
MSSANSARARTIVPSHGVGRITPWEAGQSGNPSGRPAGLREVQKLAREKSITALRALIGLVEDVDANGLPNQDGRSVVVAAQTILTWGYGRPPDYDPREDKPPVVIDTSMLTNDERAALLAILRKGILREADPEPAAVSPPAEIEGMSEGSSSDG